MRDKNHKYFDLLQSEEWKTKRRSILNRDNHKCQKCDISEEEITPRTLNGIEVNVITKNVLHIHHKYYKIFNYEFVLPWNYDNDCYITLCKECHIKEHEENEIPIYIDEKNTINLKNLTNCFRCNGSGYLPEFNYYLNGVCFRCGGTRFEEFINKDNTYLKSVIKENKVTWIESFSSMKINWDEDNPEKRVEWVYREVDSSEVPDFIKEDYEPWMKEFIAWDSSGLTPELLSYFKSNKEKIIRDKGLKFGSESDDFKSKFGCLFIVFIWVIVYGIIKSNT